MKSLAISEFKTRCIAELKALQRTGEELEITLRGKPIAWVVPVREGKRLGAHAGLMRIHGDIVTSDLDDDIDDREIERLHRQRP